MHFFWHFVVSATHLAFLTQPPFETSEKLNIKQLEILPFKVEWHFNGSIHYTLLIQVKYKHCIEQKQQNVAPPSTHSSNASNKIKIKTKNREQEDRNM